MGTKHPVSEYDAWLQARAPSVLPIPATAEGDPDRLERSDRKKQIWSAAARLSSFSGLRYAALQIMRGESVAPEEYVAIARALRRPRPWQRRRHQLAMLLLDEICANSSCRRNLGPSLSKDIDISHGLRGALHRWFTRCAVLWALATAATFAIVSICCLTLHDPAWPVDAIPTVTAVVGVITAALLLISLPVTMPGSLIVDTLRTHVEIPRIAALGRLRCAASIGTLATVYNNWPLRVAATEALESVLNSIRSELPGRLADRAMAGLCRLLRREPLAAGLEAAILDALDAAGDARAIPAVERLARSGNDRAAQVLITLIARRDEAAAASTFLRPAPPSAFPDTELLKPASSANGNPAELLHTVEANRHDSLQG